MVLTAIRLEFDAVLAVDAGAVAGSRWEIATGPQGLPVAFRPFYSNSGRAMRVAAAVSPDMGATAAMHTLLPLVAALEPRCVAMCGVCAGRRGKTGLGDVVAADRLFYHDTGRQLADRVQQDLTTYKLRDDWKAALEGLDVIARFRDAEWFQRRPITTEWREHRALIALHDELRDPWSAVEMGLGAEDWKRIIDSLRERGLLEESGRVLTGHGRRVVEDLLFEHQGGLPDLSPGGRFQPFRLHVAPMGSGARIIEDDSIWGFVSTAVHKTLALETEGAALGELAHRQRGLDVVVMKGVMDFVDHGRDEHFKEFAARAAAECLFAFLRSVPGIETTADAGKRSRASNQEAPSSQPSTSRSTPRHTILFLAANPVGTPRAAVDRQARAIQKELEASSCRDQFVLEVRFAATPLDLLRELRRLRPTVVHFSGHGNQNGLYFEGVHGGAQLVSTAALEDTFGAAGDSVKLVVFNACYSEPHAEALLAHVGCVVGVSGAIGDDSATSFAIGFYGGLGERASIMAAYQQGRAAIRLDGLPDGDRPQLKARDGVDARQFVLATDSP